ncbi:MAG: hypothetical protein HPY62_02545 [Bacteroidales bacterium]|nr:hypothetical protein [Bacteroidales bacterium]
MNSQKDFEKDILKQYLNRETFEKAPEGFAMKTMARVRLEAGHARPARPFRLSIPFISLMATAIFVLIITLMPETQNSYREIPFINFIQDIKLSLPDLRFKIGPLPKVDLPEWSLCFFGAILLLGILDIVLSGIFGQKRP